MAVWCAANSSILSPVLVHSNTYRCVWYSGWGHSLFHVYAFFQWCRLDRMAAHAPFRCSSCIDRVDFAGNAPTNDWHSQGPYIQSQWSHSKCCDWNILELWSSRGNCAALDVGCRFHEMISPYRSTFGRAYWWPLYGADTFLNFTNECEGILCPVQLVNHNIGWSCVEIVLNMGDKRLLLFTTQN